MTRSKPSTVLVTGALGFIGQHVARHWSSRGHRVVGIGHEPAHADGNCGLVRWVAADVSRDALIDLEENIDLIVHCAGGSRVGASFDDPDAEFRNSVGAAFGVLEYARHQVHSPSLVVLSSAAVYGNVAQLPIREDAPLAPISPYGRAKLAIERHCHQYGSEYGLRICVVRLFSVYGRGLRKQLFWDACQKFASGDARFSGTGEERRDWLHVDDAVTLIEAAANYASEAVPVVNGGTGHSVKVRDALAMLRSAWSRATATEIEPLSFSGEARVGDPPGYEADTTLARTLPWQSTQNLSEGLADYAAWVHRSPA